MIRAEIAPAPRRDHWLLICHSERGLVKQRFFQDRSVRRPEGWEIREHFPVLEETVLTTEEAEAWLESLMAENVAERGNLIPYKWTVHWNCWQLPRRFQPSSELPLLAETLRLSVANPNFYFHNGPANTFGLNSHFGQKLTRILRSRAVSTSLGGMGGKIATSPFYMPPYSPSPFSLASLSLQTAHHAHHEKKRGGWWDGGGFGKRPREEESRSVEGSSGNETAWCGVDLKPRDEAPVKRCARSNQTPRSMEHSRGV